jgi:polar amino acid transport system substrate-binding protein
MVGGLLASMLTACGMTFTRPGTGGDGGGCQPGKPVHHAAPKPLAVHVPKNAEAAAKVPDDVRAKGTLVIAEDPSYAPDEFTLPGSSQVVGMDIDLGRAIGQVLGLKVTFANTTFDGIVPGLGAHRYDLGMSSLTDTAKREKVVDFVTYFKAGTSIVVQKCNPKHIDSFLDLCGKKVGAENGTIQIDQLRKEQADGSIVAKCRQKGKQPPVAKGYPQQTGAASALASSRIDAYIADSPVVAYALKQTTGAFQKAGSVKGVAPYGIAVPKHSGTMKNAVAGAVRTLMKDGTYLKILKNWGLTDGKIDRVRINAA